MLKICIWVTLFNIKQNKNIYTTKIVDLQVD